MYIFYVRVWNSEVVPSNKQNSSHLLENAGNISQNLLLEKSKKIKKNSVRLEKFEAKTNILKH